MFTHPALPIIGTRQGTSNRALQEWMGHGSITVIMNIYGHLFPDEHDRARAAMNAALTD
jgi:integrase